MDEQVAVLTFLFKKLVLDFTEYDKGNSIEPKITFNGCDISYYGLKHWLEWKPKAISDENLVFCNLTNIKFVNIQNLLVVIKQNIDSYVMSSKS